MSAALALALMLAAAEPAKAVHPAAVKADPCKRLDAESNPNCSRLPPAAAAPRAAVNAAPKAEPPPDEAAAPPTANAPVPRPAGKPPPDTAKAPPAKSPARQNPVDKAADVLGARPILVGSATGLFAVLVIGATLAGVARGRRRLHANGPPASPHGSAPTRRRRDLVLTDQEGRDWRIAGAHLTPSAVVGADGDCELRRSEPDIAGRHAEFWVREGRLMLRRLADPVFLNDRRLTDITPEVVSTGDQLRLGSTAFTITID